jgi:hypothetical protein
VDYFINSTVVIVNIAVVKMNYPSAHLSFWALIFILLAGCTKPEGEGGASVIYGKVYAFNYNSSGVLKEEYYLADEDVFIIYGDGDNYYDDSYETSFDGSFRFQYLRPGTYTVFVYSDCESCPSGTEEVSQTVEIYSNNEDIILPDFEVRR